jgi:hypothetical protein
MTTALVKYDAMCRAIDHAYQVDEVKDIRDKALAFEAYARQAHNIDAERQACDIRIRAEKKGGRLLRAMEKKSRGSSAARSGVSEFQKTLQGAGLSRDQAKRWQQLSDVPDQIFEAALSGPKKPSREKIISTSSPVLDDFEHLNGFPSGNNWRTPMPRLLIKREISGT